MDACSQIVSEIYMEGGKMAVDYIVKEMRPVKEGVREIGKEELDAVLGGLAGDRNLYARHAECMCPGACNCDISTRKIEYRK